MCLIVYSPAGTLIDYETFDCAQAVNPDGIGVMSQRGVEKFFGPGAADDAWWYLQELAGERVAHGIHFRWATHGEISLENCHPFSAPRSDALVMHNGIIELTAVPGKSKRSDTSLFVERFMGSAPGPERSHHVSYFRRISLLIGTRSTLLILHSKTGEFTICNEDVGVWIGDLWYSNSDCLPWNIPMQADQGWLVGMDDNDRLPEELSAKRGEEWPEHPPGCEVDLREYPEWCTPDSQLDAMDD